MHPLASLPGMRVLVAFALPLLLPTAAGAVPWDPAFMPPEEHGATTASADVGEAGMLPSLFTQGARLRGKSYAQARDYLVGRGSEILPLLQERASSSDWRERWFAAVLKYRIEHPGAAAAWQKLNLYSTPGCGFLRRTREGEDNPRDHYGYYGDDPSFYNFPDDGASPAPLPGEPPAMDHALFVDLLWEYTTDYPSDKHNSDSSRHAHELCPVGREFASRPALELLDPLLDALRCSESAANSLRGFAHEGFIKLGLPAVPRLRAAVEEARYYSQQRGMLPAVLALSRLGDAASVPLLAARLNDYQNDILIKYSLLDALSYMKAEEGIDPLLDQLVKCFREEIGGLGFVLEERHLKRYLLRYGAQALPALRRASIQAASPTARAVLESVILEAPGLPEGERDAAALRAEALFASDMAPQITSLVALHGRTGEDIYPVLEERLRFFFLVRLQRYRSHYGDSRFFILPYQQWWAGIAALGAMREQRAVGLLADLLKTQHVQLVDLLAKKQQAGGSAAFDFEVIRESAFSFGNFHNELAELLLAGDLALRALWRIGGEEARVAIASAGEYPEFRSRAEFFLALLAGNRDDLNAMLRSEIRVQREEAALALAALGDARGLGELLRAASRRRGPAHEYWKEQALGLGAADVEATLAELGRAEDTRERVLGESLLLERRRPELVGKWRAQLARLSELIGSGWDPQSEYLDVAARGLAQPAADALELAVRKDGRLRWASRALGTDPADRIGADSVPVVEATALFGNGVISRGIAAFTLAAFAQPRSLPVLVASLDMGEIGRVNPAAQAALTYGAAGAALLAKVPPPEPGTFDIELRMTPFRGAAAIVEAPISGIQSAEQIVQGLNTLLRDRAIDQWGHRLRVYLDLAAKSHDERLVAPLVTILGEPGLEWVHVTVLRILSGYDDPKLLPLYLERLREIDVRQYWLSTNTLHEAATAALARRLGGARAAGYLGDALRGTQDETLRCGILLALGTLAGNGYIMPVGRRVWDQGLRESERVELASPEADLSLEVAVPILNEKLSDPSFSVSLAAAKALVEATRWSAISNSRTPKQLPPIDAVAPLTAWLRGHMAAAFPDLVDYLGEFGSAEAGDLLFDLWRAGSYHFDNIYQALAKLKPGETVPLLLEKALQDESFGGNKALEVLKLFGREGARARLEVVRRSPSVATRLRALQWLDGERLMKGQQLSKAELMPVLSSLFQDLLALRRSASPYAYQNFREDCGRVLGMIESLDREAAVTLARDLLANGPPEVADLATGIITRK